MKKFNLIYSIFLMAGLVVSPALPETIQIALLILAIPAVVIFHLDNVAFCKKLDRVMAGDKSVKF